MLDIEEFEAKAIADAHAAFAKLSSKARDEFLKAHSWADNHIGSAVLFGAIVGASLVIIGLVLVW